jgi:integrase
MSDDGTNVLYLIREESVAKRKRVYGSGTIRQRGSIWYVGYRVQDPDTGSAKQHWERVGPSKEAAEYRLLEVQQRRMEARERELLGYPFSVLANEWLAAKKPTVSAKTYDLYESITRHLITSWGDTYLHQLDEVSVEILRDRATKRGLSPQTVNHHLMVAQQIFRRGQRQKLLSYNPVSGVDRMRMNRQKPQPLTPEQLRKLFTVLPERYTMLFRVLLATGMRVGEALALSVNDWDAASRTLHIRRTITRAKGKIVLPEYGTKTSAGVRSLRIDQQLASAIDAHIAATAAERAQSDLGLLFPSQSGTVINPSNLRNRVWRDAAISAGLPSTKIHLLRHTWASEQIAAGRLPITTISAMLGHASAQVTLGTYSHIIDRHRSEEATLSLDLSAGSVGGGDVVSVGIGDDETGAQSPQQTQQTQKRPAVSMKQAGRRGKAA